MNLSWFWLSVLFCLSVGDEQSRTPALVFECINNTDFKVQSSPLVSCGFLCCVCHIILSALTSHVILMVCYQEAAAFRLSLRFVFPSRSCTRSWQITISVSICMNYWRWDWFPWTTIYQCPDLYYCVTPVNTNLSLCLVRLWTTVTVWESCTVTSNHTMWWLITSWER